MAPTESVSDIVENIAEMTQEIVEEAVPAASTAAVVAAELDTAADPPSWEEQYSTAQQQLQESFSGLGQARASISASSTRVSSARDALALAESDMESAHSTVIGSLDSGITAIDGIVVLLQEHRDRLVAARNI